MNPEKSGFNPPEEEGIDIPIADDGSEATEATPDAEEAMADVAETGKSEAERAVDDVVKIEDERQIEEAKKKIAGLAPDADISRDETKEALEDIEDIVGEKPA